MSDVAKQSSTNPITELKVSGHLMTMEEGLFCVYNTPGSAPPDAATGLPGVRLTAAPGQGGFSGRVSISGFGSDGWLAGADGAALVRVHGGAAQVLVTVYQAADGAHDAPKLQVIRLTDEPAAQAATAPVAEPPVPQQPVSGPPLEVAAHIYGRGDVGGHLGDWMGDPGSNRWIEGFGLAPNSGVAAADIEYQAVLGRGWLSPWAEGGQFCGSRGMSLPILGLRVRLRGAAAAAYHVVVSATFVDGTKVGPVSDGAACEAPSLSPLEAFNVSLRPIGEAAAAPGAKPAARRTGKTRGAAPAVQVPEPVKPAKRGKTPALAATLPEPQAPAKPARRSKASAAAAMAPPSSEPQKSEPQKPGPQKPDLQHAPPPLKPAAKPPAKRTPATTRRR